MIYYDSKTGNTEKFVKKVAEKTNEELLKVDADTVVSKQGHFVTYTIGKGELSSVAKNFLKNNNQMILTVSSSGGIEKHKDTFGFAVDKTLESYPHIKEGIRFDKEGNEKDVENFVNLLNK